MLTKADITLINVNTCFRSLHMGLYLQSINASMAASLPSGKLRLSAILMIFAIIGIGVFQAYWLKKLFAEEWTDLKKETNIAFRDAVYKLQWQRFRNDTTFSRHKTSISVFLIDTPDSIGGGLPDQDTAGKPRIMTFSFKSRGADDSVLRKIPMPLAAA